MICKNWKTLRCTYPMSMEDHSIPIINYIQLKILTFGDLELKRAWSNWKTSGKRRFRFSGNIETNLITIKVSKQKQSDRIRNEDMTTSSAHKIKIIKNCLHHNIILCYALLTIAVYLVTQLGIRHLRIVTAGGDFLAVCFMKTCLLPAYGLIVSIRRNLLVIRAIEEGSQMKG